MTEVAQEFVTAAAQELEAGSWRSCWVSAWAIDRRSGCGSQGLPSDIKGAKAGNRQKWVTGDAEQVSVGEPTGDQEQVSAGPPMRN